MLSRKHKLSRNTFPRHTDPKNTWMGVVLCVQAYKKTNDGGASRFAVVVPKRLSSNAVMRNTFRRRVMTKIEKNIFDFHQLLYQKYVIIPKEHLRVITRERIGEDIEAFLMEHRVKKSIVST